MSFFDRFTKARRERPSNDEPLCRYFGVPCLKHGCAQYVQIRGKDPQTGKDIDKWMCIDEAMLILGMEQAGMQKGTTAALESFRNEVVRREDRRYAIEQQQAGEGPWLLGGKGRKGG